MLNSRHRQFVWGASILIAVLIALEIYLWLFQRLKLYHVRHEVEASYEHEIKPFLPQAIEDLKTNSNDWLVCTDVGLSLNEDTPQTRAAFIAYYRYGKEYCTNWWLWQKNPCKVMTQQMNSVPDRLQLEKKIALCELAQRIK